MLGATEISGSCLFPLIFQVNTWTHNGPGSGLLPLRSQTHTWTHRDLWFLPTPLEIPDSCPDPQISWLRSIPLKVSNSCPDPQRSLSLAHLLCGCSPVPVPVEYTVSDLFWPRLLAQSWFANVPGLNQLLLLWSLLSQAHSGLGSWCSTTPVKFCQFLY